MTDLAAVFIVIAHFTVMGYGGDAVPEGKRVAFASLDDCRKAIPAVRRSFERSGLPTQPDRIFCERLEIKP